VKIRQYEHDYFNNWRDSKVSSSEKDYIWPQLVYSTVGNQILGIVFEQNKERKNAIKWPSLKGMDLGLDFININFCFKATNYQWKSCETDKFINGLSSELSLVAEGKGNYEAKKISIKTFEDYVRNTLHNRSLSCVDIDVLEYGKKEGGPKYVGIEGTHLEVPLTSNNTRKLMEGLLTRRFLKANAHQLNVQKSFMNNLASPLYLLIYNIEKCTCCNEYALSESGMSILIKIDNCFLDLINDYKNTMEDKEKQTILDKMLGLAISGLDTYKNNYNKLLKQVCDYEI
jgi:hypothetical protein